MQDLIIYLLKSAGLLSLFYAGYFFLLKNDTSFKTNRMFLLVGIVTSLLLPSLEITRTVEVEATTAPLFSENFTNEVFLNPAVQPETIDWWHIAGIVYLIGLGFLLLKFLFELVLLLKLILTHKKSREGDYYLIRIFGNTQPFSFFKFIVFDPEQHTSSEIDLILKHEFSHARQWHSVDQLVTSLSVYLLWFNPLAWLYRKSVVQNLEYLADQEVIAAQVSKKEYQQTLLKISIGEVQPAFTNQFYQSFIKKRIMMLNKKSAQKPNFWKTGILLPFLTLFIFAFNVKTVAQVQELVEVSYSYEAGKHLAIITKDAKPEELEKLEKDFAENGVELNFSEIKRSAEGTITSIALSYKDEKTGNSGSYNQNEPEGIAGFAITINDGKVSMKSYSPSSSPEHERGSAVLSKIGEKPLIIIAGKEYKKDDLNGKFIWIKSGLQVLKASGKYGSKGKDGVIIISEGEIIEDYDAHLKEIDRENKNVNREYFGIMEDQQPFFASIEKRKDGKPNTEEIIPDAEEIIAVQYENESTRINTQKTKPLFVVEGEIQEKDFDVSTIDPSIIKSLIVLRGEDAIKKYGKRAKDGVIEIELKSEEELKATGATSNTKEKDFTMTIATTQFDDSKKSQRLTVRDVGSAQSIPSDFLYVVDGKEMKSDFNPDSIAPEDIESIKVLKGDKAIAKYGQKAQEGVIEIKTKG